MVVARQRIHGAERADRDLSRCESGHQRQRDLPVETQRREHVFEPVTDHACKAVEDRRARRSRRRCRKAAQEPQHDHHRQDDRADALHENPAPFPQPDRQVVRVRPVELWQLEQQRVITRAHRRALQCVCDRHRGDDACYVQGKEHQPLQVERSDRAAGDEGGDDQRVHRQACGARHQRRDHDRRHAVAGFGMVRVAMMPGTAQAKLDSSGMKARPERPTLPISRSSRKAARGR